MRDFDWAYLGSGSFWSVRATRHGWWHARFALIASEARRRIGAKWPNRTHAPPQTTCTGCKRRRKGHNHLLAHGLVTSSEATKKKDAQMLSRRSFLNNTLGAGLALTTAQQAAAQTPAVQPARNRLIVDARVHLWKAESPDWPWVPGMKPQMPEPFTIEKLVPLMDEAGVDRAVIVPPSWPGDRNDYGIEAAERYPNRFAVM